MKGMTPPKPSGTSPDAAILKRVEHIVRRALSPHRANVYLFGSWARGLQRPASDIDVAIEGSGPLPPGVLAGLREALEESTIPYPVDIVDLADTEADFRERVHREGVLWIASSSG